MSGIPAGLLERLSAIDAADPAATLAAFRGAVPGRLVFTTSFGIEDQVLTHLILGSGLDIEFVTLDTGRLFPETYDLWAATEHCYGIRIRAVFPDRDALAALLAAQGVNGFYESPAARKSCCDVRKVAPLARALTGAAGWITGLRSDQSPARMATPLVAWDAERSLIKLNPLIAWHREQAASFAERHHIPISPLHAQGFLSIGCAPCTRAIRPGESERAGRWWWEEETKKECGLHLGSNGRLERIGREERQ